MTFSHPSTSREWQISHLFVLGGKLALNTLWDCRSSNKYQKKSQPGLLVSRQAKVAVSWSAVCTGANGWCCATKDDMYVLVEIFWSKQKRRVSKRKEAKQKSKRLQKESLKANYSIRKKDSHKLQNSLGSSEQYSLSTWVGITNNPPCIQKKSPEDRSG